MPWPLRQLPQSASPLQLPATTSSYLTEMMRLAEDGGMFTIARFEKQFSYLCRSGFHGHENRKGNDGEGCSCVRGSERSQPLVSDLGIRSWVIGPVFCTVREGDCGCRRFSRTEDINSQPDEYQRHCPIAPADAGASSDHDSIRLVIGPARC